MKIVRTGDGSQARPVRADARKNIAAILEAATSCLARDPDVSVAAIALAAGVGRVTLYAHFESRAVLISAVAEQAMQQTADALAVADLDGEDPRAALERLIEATWRLTRTYGALVVAADKALPPAMVMQLHAVPLKAARRLFERGQRDKVFPTKLPADWLGTTLHTLIHAAAGAVHRGEVADDDAPHIILTTMLGVLGVPNASIPQ